MNKLNIDVPDEIALRIQSEAAAVGKSVSEFLVEVITCELDIRQDRSAYFSNFFGTFEGEFPEIDRLPPQNRKNDEST